MLNKYCSPQEIILVFARLMAVVLTLSTFLFCPHLVSLHICCSSTHQLHLRNPIFFSVSTRSFSHVVQYCIFLVSLFLVSVLNIQLRISNTKTVIINNTICISVNCLVLNLCEMINITETAERQYKMSVP